MTDAEELGLPPHAFAKQDGGDDLAFYGPARLVSHIDEAAIAALTGLYADLLPPGSRILDLLSSGSAICRRMSLSLRWSATA